MIGFVMVGTNNLDMATKFYDTLLDVIELERVVTNEKYNLSEINLKINDLFVVKYEDTQQSHLKFHTDGSIISFNILLDPLCTGK